MRENAGMKVRAFDNAIEYVHRWNVLALAALRCSSCLNTRVHTGTIVDLIKCYITVIRDFVTVVNITSHCPLLP